MRYRYTADEIQYCLDLCKADALIFGQAFIGCEEAVIDLVPCVKELFYVGDAYPTFCESDDRLGPFLSGLIYSLYGL